jgi:hypothetical protein
MRWPQSACSRSRRTRDGGIGLDRYADQAEAEQARPTGPAPRRWRRPRCGWRDGGRRNNGLGGGRRLVILDRWHRGFSGVIRSSGEPNKPVSYLACGTKSRGFRPRKMPWVPQPWQWATSGHEFREAGRPLRPRQGLAAGAVRAPARSRSHLLRRTPGAFRSKERVLSRSLSLGHGFVPNWGGSLPRTAARSRGGCRADRRRK